MRVEGAVGPRRPPEARFGTNHLSRPFTGMSDLKEPSQFELGLARAFDLAWVRFLEIEGAVADTADNRGSLAARIIVLAQSGESNEEQLGSAALIYLRALMGAKRLPQQNVGHVKPASLIERYSSTFDPATLDVMRSALDGCLEQLPLRLPSHIITVLSESILADAAAGVRDRQRLCEQAMKALKDRH
jgi:hypothetical protein